MQVEADRLAKLLESVGIDKYSARILAFLHLRGDLTTRELEQLCDFQQPVVSTATTSLRKRGWIESYIIKSGTRGRPQYAYRLAKPLKKIVVPLLQKKKEEVRKVLEDIAELEKIL